MTQTKEQENKWEEVLLTKLIELGKEEYEASFFAEMLIKVLWVLQGEK